MFFVPNTALSIEREEDIVFVYWGSHGEVCYKFVEKDDGYWYDIDGDIRLGKSIVDVVDSILDFVSEMTDDGDYYEAEAAIRLNLLGL